VVADVIVSFRSLCYPCLLASLGLRKKSVVPMGDHAAAQLQNDLFGNTDAVIKFVLEGHEGVNWASFHPTLPLIISGSDDRQLKLWRWSDTKAWEVDTLRAHYNSVTCCVFHPTQEIMVSCAEDKTVRIWDMSKRSLLSTYRREQERFWVVAAHPELSLFAAGHDGGLILFKLEKERPAYATWENSSVFYLKDRYIRNFDLKSGKDVPVAPTKVRKESQPRALQYNPGGAVLITFEDAGGSWELYFFQPDARNISGEVLEAKKGAGKSAVWIARSRFAVWDVKANAIYIKNLTGQTTKTIPSPVQGTTIDGLFPANNGCVLLKLDNNKLVLYDLQQKREVAECTSPGANVKFVVWASQSADSLVAIMTKDVLTIATSRLEVLCSVTERTKIKSGVFNEEGIFMYTTTSHIKYLLPNGDGGIVRTLKQPIYMTGAIGAKLYCLDRETKNRGITVDATEYLFKNALHNKRYQEVLNIVRGTNILGQSIVSYLQTKGFPEVALYFVKEEQTRFDLALECGNIEKALQAALKLERADVWVRLAEAALQHGNHAIVELAYQKTNNYERLSFLYLITGQLQKLKTMEKFAEKRGDFMSVFHNALYLGDVPTRIKVFEMTGQLSLAYLTAKTHGMLEHAERIKSRLESRLAESQPPQQQQEQAPNVVDEKLPFVRGARMMLPPMPMLRNEEGTWPLLAPARGPFDAFLTSSDASQLAATSYIPDESIEESSAELGEGWNDEEESGSASKSAAVASAAKSSGASSDANAHNGAQGETEGAWELELADHELPQLAKPTVAGPAPVTLPREGPTAQHSWLSSEVPADHIAAGSFETAMRLLHAQLGIVNFAPLKSHFLAIASTSHTLLSALPSTTPLEVPLLRNWAQAASPVASSSSNGLGTPAPNKETGLPIVSIQFPMLVERLQAAYRSFTTGKFQDALEQFRSILHLLPVITANSLNEASEAKELIGIVVEYILGLQIEMKRKEVAASPSAATSDPLTLARICELGAYFTHCNLQPTHIQLTLRSAMNNAVKAKNFGSAYNFAKRLLDLAPKPEIAQTAQRVAQLCDQNGLKDEIANVDYDERNPFVVCAASMKPIYRGTPSTTCPYCGSHYHQEHNGITCTICNLAKVGAHATGLTLIKPIAARRPPKRSLADE